MSTDPALARAARKWRIKSGISVVLPVAILIGGSGRSGWIEGWAYLLVVFAGLIATYLTMARKSPDLIVERAKIQPGTKWWDKVLAPLIALVFPMATWIPAALDASHGWLRVPAPLEAAGFVVMVAGVLLTLQAMVANRFFASTVRIRAERGQTVISALCAAVLELDGYAAYSRRVCARLVPGIW